MTEREANALKDAGLFGTISIEALCKHDFDHVFKKLLVDKQGVAHTTNKRRAAAFQQLINQGFTLPENTMNDLKEWLKEMENVGGTKREPLPENDIEQNMPEPLESKLNLGKEQPQGLREVKYSPPAREPKLFEQMLKPENQQQQGQGKQQPQQPQQQMPPQKSATEHALEVALAAVREQEMLRNKQQEEQRQQQEQQQAQQVDNEAIDAIHERIDGIDERLTQVEKNYVGEVTFNDSIQALEKQLANVSKPRLIMIPDRPEVKIDKRPHAAFEEALLLAQVFKQSFFVGPAGTGKTSLSNDVAKAMSLDFGFISCTAGLAEAHLLGRMLADGTYVPARFVELYENGGVFLFDEVDAADANTLLVVNSALANGYLSVPNRRGNPVAHRHPDFVCLVAANTLGTGSFEYHGRNYLDAAFLDRFALSRLRVDYDLDLEREILAGDAEMARVLHKMRSNLELTKTRRLVSTRAFVSTAQLLLVGKTPDYVIAKLTLGWTDEEKNRAMKDVVVPKSSPLIQIGIKQREAAKTKREQEAAQAKRNSTLTIKDRVEKPAKKEVQEAVAA